MLHTSCFHSKEIEDMCVAQFSILVCLLLCRCLGYRTWRGRCVTNVGLVSDTVTAQATGFPLWRDVERRCFTGVFCDCSDVSADLLSSLVLLLLWRWRWRRWWWNRLCCDVASMPIKTGSRYTTTYSTRISPCLTTIKFILLTTNISASSRASHHQGNSASSSSSLILMDHISVTQLITIKSYIKVLNKWWLQSCHTSYAIDFRKHYYTCWQICYIFCHGWHCAKLLNQVLDRHYPNVCKPSSLV